MRILKVLTAVSLLVSGISITSQYTVAMASDKEDGTIKIESSVKAGESKDIIENTGNESNGNNEGASDKEFTPEPKNNLEPIYKKEGKKVSASIPIYSNYTEEDVIKILGEPEEIMESGEDLINYLENDELFLIKREIRDGNLTASQGKAFLMQKVDATLVIKFNGGEGIKGLYFGKEKPFVLIRNGKLFYISPITKYINFKGEIKK